MGELMFFLNLQEIPKEYTTGKIWQLLNNYSPSSTAEFNILFLAATASFPFNPFLKLQSILTTKEK